MEPINLAQYLFDQLDNADQLAILNFMEELTHRQLGVPSIDVNQALASDALDADRIATQIRQSDQWDPDLNMELCRMAGLEEAYKNADADHFEEVVFKAADILGVDLLEEPDPDPGPDDTDNN